MRSASSRKTTARVTSRRPHKPALRIKRAYEPAQPSDGQRILVDRVWPRGISKADLELDAWYRDIAPSTELRTWFGHEPARWAGFRKRYAEELRRPEIRPLLRELIALCKRGNVTLIYSARDEEHNQAVVLRDFLKTRLAKKPS